MYALVCVSVCEHMCICVCLRCVHMYVYVHVCGVCVCARACICTCALAHIDAWGFSDNCEDMYASCVFMESPVSVQIAPCLHVCLWVGWGLRIQR